MLKRASRHVTTGKRDRAILAMLLGVGLRSRELCALTLDDVRDDWRDVVIVRDKSGTKREVCRGLAAGEALHDYLDLRRQQTTQRERALFVTEKWRPINELELCHVVRTTGELAGLDEQPLTAHRLRRTATSTQWQAYRAAKQSEEGYAP